MNHLQGFNLEIQNSASHLLQWIENLGYLGSGIYILAYILTTLVLIPATFLTLGAGSIYGVIRGSILVSLASILAATVAFVTGRYLARGWVAKQIENRANFRAIDEAVGREGWKIVALTRLSPIFPFVFLNYAFSLTKVSLKDFVLTSWISMMPGTVMYVYIGSLIGDIALFGKEERQRTPLEWGLYIIGLVATIAVTVYVTRIARKALNTRIE